MDAKNNVNRKLNKGKELTNGRKVGKKGEIELSERNGRQIEEQKWRKKGE